MPPLDFDTSFEQLTQNKPFPWQQALYQKFADGDFPSSCNLPTGLGKTSIIAIWLIALKNHPEKVPRRLVYVVNRRTVVDQTTTEVERLRDNLKKLIPVEDPLAISTLRGQYADNCEWSADPSLPAVICGTVDMIGSRLLFSGYGLGYRSRPLHAGFLGQDVLLVHDEAHLEPAFQKLIIAIESEQRQGRFPDRQPLRVMELSATSRGEDEPFTLTSEDKKNDVVNQRIHATKKMVFHPIDDEKKELADKLAKLALAHRESNGAILIFVRLVEDLGKVVTALRKETSEVQQLTGTMRGLERDELIEDPIFKRFMPNAQNGDKTVYLVCTSAGEVGVNISADHLICDLSTFESMAQRFGRVNRFGLRNNTQIDIVHPTIFEKDDEIDERREKTLVLLKSLKGSGSPAALGGVDPEQRLAAFSPQPDILPISGILFDAWALTSIRDKLPGRPPVAEYLHGKSEWEPAQTKVAWRSEVWELNRPFATNRERQEFQRYAAELLEDYPLKSLESLTDRSDRVFNTLKKLPATRETPVWIVDDEEKVRVTTLGELTDRDWKSIADATLLLPPQAGGLESGFLNASAKYDPKQTNYDVADKWEDKDGPLRQRQLSKPDDEPSALSSRMKLVREIFFSDHGDDDAEPIKVWNWYVRSLVAEADAKSVKEYGLQLHLDDAQADAKKFVSTLLLDAEHRQAVIFAATHHDLGKDRENWQRGIGNSDYPAQKWAKSGKRQAATQRSSYRHEFGSLLDVQAHPEFGKLSPDSKDLVLHLIAAHHGRGRPHFPTDEIFDDNYSESEAQSLALEVTQRFARLQRKFGRWGLAYFESLVRAADISASRKAERREP